MINELYCTTEEQIAALTLMNRSVEEVELMAQDNSTMVGQLNPESDVTEHKTSECRINLWSEIYRNISQASEILVI
ncbi:hypothetical protein [Citrobacter koseri]|uniref:hypothetical protein n=1 Tax=Citrobacter koseri TaxID=545 RepID=UPI00389127AB